MTRKGLLIVCAALCLLGAGGVLVWHFWPEPPPTTAEQVVASVMEGEPGKMSEKEVSAWIQDVASMTNRLPPHEMQKLVEKALGDEKLRERFESLPPEERRKLVELVSEEQRARMMAKMATGMVEMLKAMPPPLRKLTLEQMRERRAAFRGEGKGKRPEMTKDRVAQWLAATTPTQRAEMVRAMREMRKMMEEAGMRE